MSKRYLDFEIVKESWSVYDLQDGTRIKVRFMLESIMNAKERKRQMEASHKIIALCDESVCGEPSRETYTAEHMQQSIEIKHCKYSTLRYEPSEYILDDNSRVLVHHNILRISRTHLFNQRGDRIYYTGVNANITVSP